MDGNMEHGHMGGSTESDDTTLFAGFWYFRLSSTVSGERGACGTRKILLLWIWVDEIYV